MSTRSFPNRSPGIIRDYGDHLARRLCAVRSRVVIDGRLSSAARRRLVSRVSDQPWRLGIGIVAVLVPAVLLAMLGPSVPVTTPGIVFILAVAGSTYLADWVGGATSLLLSAVMLDLFFVGGRSDLGMPSTAEEATGVAVTLVSGGALVWLIQRIKGESMIDRRRAIAARAAATAFASLEGAAATHAAGSAEGRQSLHASLLRSMVSVNRAHVGLLFLGDPLAGGLTLAGAYGLEAMSDEGAFESPMAAAFATQVGSERRSRRVGELPSRPGYATDPLGEVNVRSLLGVPMIGADDRLLGVVVVGLYVRHTFTATEIARLEALASRSAAVLQAAVGIDERESALTYATEATHWLELVIAAMPEAVVLAMPPEGRIVAENQAAVALLGQLLGSDDARDLESRLSMPDGEPIGAASNPIKQAFATGEVVVGTEMLVRSATGVPVPVLVSAAPVRKDDGPVVAVVAVFRDIAALKEASRLKDEFVSVVSHELRSPLTPIRGFVQLVAKDLAKEGGHDPQVGRLNSIAGHVDRMTRLVDDLLDVSRLKAGSLEIRRGRCDLVELCRDVIRDRSAANQSHRYALDAPAEVVPGDWDADRLYQVIDNLVGNAIKYTPPGGTITINAAMDQANGGARVTVSDQGPGIAAADRERIFSAFYRTPEAAASRITGLGLGLYICHELVAAHGGTIEVGDADGGGAAFTVRLPLVTTAIAA